MQQLQTMTCRC